MSYFLWGFLAGAGLTVVVYGLVIVPAVRIRERMRALDRERERAASP